MSFINNLQREWKAYASPRLWILGVLLLVLCVLALVQYHWIDQVAHAERQRAKTTLNTALSDLQNDFDIEITRVVAVFQFPTTNSADFSDRYKEWLRRSPYPNLVRGVYILETKETGLVLNPTVQGEPRVLSSDWQKDLAPLALPQAVTATSPIAGRANAFGLFAQGAFVRSQPFPNPGILIDGNPAFVFPILPKVPQTTAPTVTRVGRISPAFGSIEVRTIAGPLPSQWAVVVLDANYLETTLLPNLVRKYFQSRAGSDYDILVVDKTPSRPQRIVFRSESALPENQFAHPDGSVGLFTLRLDCFLPPASTSPQSVAGTHDLQYLPQWSFSSSRAAEAAVVGVAPGLPVLTSADHLSEILSASPANCSSPTAFGGNSQGPWEMSAHYRQGSLDQAMVTFRHRSLLLSGGVLFVLALGVCMLVLLTERARSLAEMQMEFVLGVSHELRTPLTVVRLAADNLRQDVVQDSAQARRYGEIIATHASELSNMIEEILAFARIQSASLISKRLRVSPEQIVRESLANCEQALQSAGIEVELRVGPDLPFVEANIRMLNRCLENLIHNVIKYAAAGRWMAITVERVTLRDEERVKISVEDHGPGISSADLPRIFEPFYRGHYGEILQVPGVGLGLTLVKRVVEAHLGRVEVKSKESGASFSILLPPSQPILASGN